jgi:hypothetical protein
MGPKFASDQFISGMAIPLARESRKHEEPHAAVAPLALATVWTVARTQLAHKSLLCDVT